MILYSFLLLAVSEQSPHSPALEPQSDACREGDQLRLIPSSHEDEGDAEIGQFTVGRTYTVESVNGCAFKVSAFRAAGLATMYLESGLEVMLPVHSGKAETVVLRHTTGERRTAPVRRCDAVSRPELRRSMHVTLFRCADGGSGDGKAALDGNLEGFRLGARGNGNQNDVVTQPRFETFTISVPLHGWTYNVGASAQTSRQTAVLALGGISLKE